jgi:hypothetical protein
MQMPALNPDIVIITLLLLSGVYGLVGGKHRLRLLILSIYVGVVLAEQLGAVVRPYIGVLGPEQISWLLLGLPIVLFGFARSQHGSHQAKKGSAVANILVGLGAGALILSSGLHLLPTSSLSAIDRDSFLAMQLQQYHLWLLGLLPVVALILGFLKGKDKHH